MTAVAQGQQPSGEKSKHRGGQIESRKREREQDPNLQSDPELGAAAMAVGREREGGDGAATPGEGGEGGREGRRPGDFYKVPSLPNVEQRTL